GMQPGLPAEADPDLARFVEHRRRQRGKLRDAGDVCPGHANGQVREPMGAELPPRERRAELLAALNESGTQVGEVDRLGLRIARGEPVARTPDHDHAPRIDERLALGDDVLAGDAHGEVVEAVAVEVRGGQGGAETIAALGTAGYAGGVLRPE